MPLGREVGSSEWCAEAQHADSETKGTSRATASIVIMASTEGGMDIEETAAKSPEKITRVAVNPLLGLQPHHIRQVVFGLGVAKESMKQWMTLISSLYRLFVENDWKIRSAIWMLFTDN